MHTLDLAPNTQPSITSFVYYYPWPQLHHSGMFQYMGCGIAVAMRLCILTESCIYLHCRRTAFTIKGAPEQTFNLTIHSPYHMSTYLRAHQQAYLIRGTECTGQEVTDVQGYEYLLALSSLLAHTLYLLIHSTHPPSLYQSTQYIGYMLEQFYPKIYYIFP